MYETNIQKGNELDESTASEIKKTLIEIPRSQKSSEEYSMTEKIKKKYRKRTVSREELFKVLFE